MHVDHNTATTKYNINLAMQKENLDFIFDIWFYISVKGIDRLPEVVKQR